MLYYSYNNYLKEKFACRVYKVSIDAGFTCPNRDGTKGFGGCTFCDETGSSSRTHLQGTSITKQVQKNIAIRKSRYKAKKFIAYFQSHTNSYAPTNQLKKIYDEAIEADPDIIGLTISTRPDCIDEKKLALIASYKKRLPYVSIEYGMQTKHDKTLKAINNCSTHNDFLKAIELTKKYDLDHCVHVILGLPNEGRKQLLETANTLAKLDIQGIKIHLLVAMENTPLAQSYLRGKWHPLTFEEYIPLVCDFIERLPPSCVIHRLSGNGHPKHLVAPRWAYDRRNDVRKAITDLLSKRSTRQGSLYMQSKETLLSQ